MDDVGLRRRDFLKTASVGCVTVAGCSSPFDDDEVTPESESPPTWNVADHGIDGDGTTEVGQAIHELLETVDEAGGGIVYFPAGRYLFERTPLVGDNTSLLGAGRSTVFEGVRPSGDNGWALLSNKGYDETGYNGASNWGVRNIRIDSPSSNGVMPAHAKNVQFENIHGDYTAHHHIDIVSCTNVGIDGFRATRGGESDSDAAVQFDVQTSGIARNGIWDGSASTLANGDETPTSNCTLTNFEIVPENSPTYGVHIHRGPNESITLEDGEITGCQYTAVRSDPEELVANLTVEGVSCLENARGITLGHIERGRRNLTLSDVTIRTEDRSLAAGSGLYGAGFDGSSISNVSVNGEFQNSIIFEDMTDLQMSHITAEGATDQAFRFRENVDVTLTTARAAECGGAGIYSGPGSTVAYGGVTFDDVGREVVVDGSLKEWTTSSSA